MLRSSRVSVWSLSTSLLLGSAAVAGDCPRQWTAGWTRTLVDRQVRALATFDFDGPGPRAASLVIAGDFYSINGVVSQSPVVYDGARFAPLRTGLRAAGVRQFVTLDSDGAGPQPAELYAVGTFNLDSGPTSVGVVRWTSGIPGQSARWVPVGAPSATGITGALSMTLHDFDGNGPASPRIVAVAAGNPSAGLVQQWDGAAWTAVGANNRATGSKAVCSVDHDGPGPLPPQLYLAVGNAAPMRFNGTSWVSVSGLNEPVESAVSFDLDGPGPQTPRLIVTGSRPFNIGGRLCAVAGYDGATWSAIGPSFGFTNTPNNLIVVSGPNPGSPPSLVLAFNSFGSRLLRWNSTGLTDGGATGGWDLLAGTINQVGSATFASVAFHDPDGLGPAPADTVVGGDFRFTSGDGPVTYLATVRGTTWSPIGRFSGIPDGPVLALTATDLDGAGPLTEKLFVGGQFATVRGVTAPALATWDGREWSAIGHFVSTPESVTRVGAMTMFDDDGAGPRPAGLYVGGFFDSIDGRPMGHIARLDAGGWSALGSGFASLQISGGTFGVSAMLPVDLDGPGPGGESLVVAGGFAQVNGQPGGQIAAWNGATWTPMGAGAPGEVLGLAAFPRPSQPPLLLAINYWGTLSTWNGTNWQSTANFFSGSAGFLSFAKMVDDDGDGPLSPYLLVGGAIDAVGGRPAPQGLAKFDGQTWSSLTTTLQSRTDSAASLDLDGSGPEPVRTILAGNFLSADSANTTFAVRNLEAGGSVRYDFIGDYTLAGGITDVEAFADEPGRPPALYIGGYFSGVGLTSAFTGVPTGGLARFGCAPCVQFTRQPVAPTVRVGASVTLDAAALVEGFGATYQWRRNGSPLADGGGISGSRTAMLSIHRVSTADAGSYDLLVTASCGNMLSAAAVVTVACDADRNADGQVTSEDLLDFVQAFLLGRVVGDANRDFQVTLQDLFDFLDAYFRGQCN